MTRDLDLTLLRTFVVVGKTRNFNRAAQELCVSQSVVSERLKKLELSLGVILLDRDRQGARLTEAGSVLLDEAQQLLARSAAVADRIRAVAKGKHAVLRLASTHWAMFELAPRVLSILRREASDLTVELVHMATSEQVLALSDRTLDVGIVRADAVGDPCAVHELVTEPIMVALPSDDRLARKAKLVWRDLQDRNFILTRRQFSPSAYGKLLACCERSGFVPRVHERNVHFRTLLAHVAAGYGVALVPRSDNFQHTDIALREVKAGLQTSYVFATRSDESRESVARLIRTVQEQI